MSNSSLSRPDSDSTATEPKGSTSLNDLSVDAHLNSPPWILHKILDRELSCELPLRIMFSFNARQKLPTLKQVHKWWQYEPKGKLIIEFLSSLDKDAPSPDSVHDPPSGSVKDFNDDHFPQDRFMDAGNDVLLDIDFASALGEDRRSSQGLPPDFIQELCLNRVFTTAYRDVDFGQALTGIDYLRDLEVTRRISLREAAQRLGITKENWRDVLAQDPDAKSWVENVQTQELAIEIYYAGIFIDLRIWTMVSELQCTPFYKPNVLAMLNTLFPPSVRELPNDRINAKTFHKYRNTFYRYVLAVEADGPLALNSFINKLLRPGTKHSWMETRANLEAYIELADLMIKQATAVHGIRFFRHNSVASSELASGTKFSFTETDTTSISANTSFNSQLSPAFTPKSPPWKTFDSSSAKSRIYSRRKVSTTVDPKTYFEPLESSCSSQTLHNSGQSFRAGTPGADSATTPRTLFFDANSIKDRHRTVPRPTTPFMEPESEAAGHESFARPITPFEDIRRAIQEHRQAISSNPPAPSFEFDNSFKNSPSAFKNTPEMGSNFCDRPDSSTFTFPYEKPNLASKNLEFLQRPYEPLPPLSTTNTLQKKSSFGSLLLSKKFSAGATATTEAFDGPNALGISSNPVRSVEPLPWSSKDGSASERPTLKKQVSFSYLEKTVTRDTANSFRSRAPGLADTMENDQQKRQVKRKMSLPNFLSKKAPEPEITDLRFVETGDEYERFKLSGPTRTGQKKKLLKAKSIASFVARTGSEKTSSNRIKPRKSFLFRREPTDEIITSADISEPFPPELRTPISPFTYQDEEFRSKEFTRKWFLEESRARKYDLDRPGGDPVKEPAKRKKKTPPPEFEFPRATPKPPVRPSKQRFDSIFPRRQRPLPLKPKLHTPIDISKYNRY